MSCKVRERVVKLEHLVLGLGSRVFQQLSGNIGDHRGNQILHRPQAKLLGSLSSSPSPAFFPSSRCPSHPPPSHCVSSRFHSIPGPTGPSLCSPLPPRLEIALVFSWPSGKTDVPSKPNSPLRPSCTTLGKLHCAFGFPPLQNGLLLVPTCGYMDDCTSHVHKALQTMSGIH